MKLSELIKQIEDYIAENGDVEAGILMTDFGKTGIVRNLCIEPFNGDGVECIIDYKDE